jgi:hypothetical protein
MNAQELRLDYFKIYDVTDYRVEYWVVLKGQFDEEPEKAELLSLEYFANPVSKGKEPIYNRNAHLTWYALYQPIPEPLLAPAQKRQEGSQFPVELDHFKLYWVLELETEPVLKSLALQDQFGSEEVRVTYPVAFGVPVQKEYQGKVSPIHNEKAHLMIYSITPRLFKQTRVIRDQFGRRYLVFLGSVRLAVPSVKLEWEEWKEL